MVACGYCKSVSHSVKKIVNSFQYQPLFMFLTIHPKLPMRNLQITRGYYANSLGFTVAADYGNYLIVKKEAIEIHFFLYPELDPLTNYGQVYIRVQAIDQYYETLMRSGVVIHPNGALEDKPWGQREFSLLDPDGNLLTFGESLGE